MYEFWHKILENKKMSLTWSLVKVIVSAFMQAFVMQVFMNPCNLISGGFTGISLFISRIGAAMGMDWPVSMLIILLNVPVALFCCKAISKRFVLLSSVQFVLVSVFLDLFNFQPFFYDITINLLFGGILWGAAASLALTAGGSTGGSDFIAQYVANKIHRSIFNIVFYCNCAMYIAYGFSFGWIYCAYSIIFQFLSTTVINKTYKRYQRVTIEITTQEPDKITEAFMHTVRHGMSIIECVGAYKHQRYYLCRSTISAFELQMVCHAVEKADPHCLINVFQSLSFHGNFFQKPIE